MKKKYERYCVAYSGVMSRWGKSVLTYLQVVYDDNKKRDKTGDERFREYAIESREKTGTYGGDKPR